jgi:hypothetical protein
MLEINQFEGINLKYYELITPDSEFDAKSSQGGKIASRNLSIATARTRQKTKTTIACCSLKD